MAGLTLKEKAYERLRNLILNGSIPPGENLTERHLVELLEMSRTPIRAALERLEAEGWVTYSPNKGLSVKELSLQRVIDFFDYRMALEGYVISKLASRTFSDEEKSWFENNLAEQAKYMETNDFQEFTRRDSDFHRKLIEIYGNYEIKQTFENLQDKLFQIALNVLRKDNKRIQRSYEDHKNIYELIKQGNAEDAYKLAIQHLEFGKQILIL
ncbi:GntR family transcriptional regulator [Paenibacillus thalictri]|uniref:GntR family transcriptional regulator n=1 Tax=Paenibacillus thalictri TaxID=2527873 RepID=A0A4V2J400_9BACL|nr:GntR family transcriptional regulator [Paenibacillus thalictri]TBL76525.1 GntR family transcriptional regulator [Paenibacillus thalictri]